MGHYLSHPQSNIHSLGYSFAQKYKADFGDELEVTTEEVFKTMQDAHRYQELLKELQLLLARKNGLSKQAILKELQRLADIAPPAELLSSTERNLEQTVLHLRRSLQEYEKIVPKLEEKYKRMKASLYAAEHSIEILERELEKE